MTAPNFQFTNFAISTLAGTLSASDTTGTLALGTGALFPALSAGEVFAGILSPVSGVANEIVYVTARSGDVITIERGQEGSNAQTWAVGSNFINAVTAAAMEAALGTALIAQIGVGTVTGGGQSVTFPQPFPGGAVPAVTISDADAATWTPGNLTLYGVSNVTNTGFYVYHYTWNGSAWENTSNVTYNWIAAINE